MVRLGYDNGGLSLNDRFWAQEGPTMPAGFLRGLSSEHGSAPTAWLFLIAGMMLTFGMMAGRSRLLWFPLLPIGYLIAARRHHDGRRFPHGGR